MKLLTQSTSRAGKIRSEVKKQRNEINRLHTAEEKIRDLKDAVTTLLHYGGGGGGEG